MSMFANLIAISQNLFSNMQELFSDMMRALTGKKKIETMRFFDTQVTKVKRLSPSFIRITFKGDMVSKMRMYAPDQWIKLYIPEPDGSVARVTDQAQYNAIPKKQRPPVRTYTIRTLRSEKNEFDVDFVVHGDEGPASRWALSAKIGDQMQIRAHCHSASTKPSGCRWLPANTTKRHVLLADETALPATAGILERLETQNPQPAVNVFIEVPSNDDQLPLPQWPQLNVQYLVRDGEQKHGAMLLEASMGVDFSNPQDDLYVWLASETSIAKQLRLFLLKKKELNNSIIGAASYWKHAK